MDALRNIVTGQAPDFTKWQHADRIRFFGWFIHAILTKETFRTGDIAGCFDAVHVAPPANLTRAIQALHEQGDLQKAGAGSYKLAMHVRERYESKFGEREETVVVDRILSELPAKLADDQQREYLKEALGCFRHKYWRSAVTMTWSLAYDHLLRYTLANKLLEFNAALAASTNKGAKKRDVIASRADFNDLREGYVLELCQAGDVTDKTLSKLLKQSLDTRNDAAHPSGAVFDKLVVEPFITRLVNGCLLALKI